MEENSYEQQYTTGYNQGFLVSKYHPDLYDQIMKTADKEQPRFMGMEKGHEAQQREAFIQNLNSSQTIKEQHKPRIK